MDIIVYIVYTVQNVLAKGRDIRTGEGLDKDERTSLLVVPLKKIDYGCFRVVDFAPCPMTYFVH